MKMSRLDEKQRASVNRLLQLCREKMTTISHIYFNGCLSNIQFLPDVDNKMETISCAKIAKSDIPILMQFLATQRSDGKQRVMNMEFLLGKVTVLQNLLDAIKEV
jgi:hypothetical protein